MMERKMNVRNEMNRSIVDCMQGNQYDKDKQINRMRQNGVATRQSSTLHGSHSIHRETINQMNDQNKQTEDNLSVLIEQILDELVHILLLHYKT